MYKDKDIDSPLSESSVSLKLSLIQKRCSQLMDDTEGLELSLEDAPVATDNSDPYNQS